MKASYFGYIVDIEDEYIFIGKLTAHNWREMTPEEKATYPGYNYIGEYLRRKRFVMTPELVRSIRKRFSIGQYVKVTAENNQVKTISRLTDSASIDDRLRPRHQNVASSAKHQDAILRVNHLKNKEPIRYIDIKQQEQKLHNLIGLTVGEFDQLVPAFEKAFQERMCDYCLSGKKRIGRKYQKTRDSFLPTPEDRLLFILTYLKSKPLQVLQEELFDESHIRANPWIHTLLIVLQTALAPFEGEPYNSLKELAQQKGSPS